MLYTSNAYVLSPYTVSTQTTEASCDAHSQREQLAGGEVAVKN
jgi:hypothetical protein